MGFKSVTNSGLSDSDLKRGYSNTGAIPEDGDSLSNAEQNAKDEAKQEKAERAMAEKYGWPVESDAGGFLERQNTDDRM